jgi:hypothetical protein
MWTTEQMNRILLLLTGLLVLLVFMDVQARRHYRQISGVGESVRPLPPVTDEFPPLKGSIEEILGSEDGAVDPDAGLPVFEDRSEHSLRPVDEKLVHLYFIRYRGSRSEIVRLQRIMKSPVGPIDALKLLRNGPLPGEKGILNAFDQKIVINSLTVRDGIALLDVGEEMGRMSGRVVRDRLDQIAFTLLQYPNIRGIRLTIDGKSLRSLGQERIPVPEIIVQPDRPVADYP